MIAKVKHARLIVIPSSVAQNADGHVIIAPAAEDSYERTDP